MSLFSWDVVFPSWLEEKFEATSGRWQPCQILAIHLIDDYFPGSGVFRPVVSGCSKTRREINRNIDRKRMGVPTVRSPINEKYGSEDTMKYGDDGALTIRIWRRREEKWGHELCGRVLEDDQTPFDSTTQRWTFRLQLCPSGIRSLQLGAAPSYWLEGWLIIFSVEVTLYWLGRIMFDLIIFPDIVMIERFRRKFAL